MSFREITATDRAWVSEIVTRHFASPRVVSRGKLYDARELPGFVLEHEGSSAGLYQYEILDGALQVVVLVAVQSGRGFGRQLLDHALSFAAQQGCGRVWLVTTNNNAGAIGFYRHIGWRQCAVHENAADTARRMKPEIPLTDDTGTPIRDEIEFEFLFDRQRSIVASASYNRHRSAREKGDLT